METDVVGEVVGDNGAAIGGGVAQVLFVREPAVIQLRIVFPPAVRSTVILGGSSENVPLASMGGDAYATAIGRVNSRAIIEAMINLLIAHVTFLVTSL